MMVLEFDDVTGRGGGGFRTLSPTCRARQSTCTEVGARVFGCGWLIMWARARMSS